VHVSELDDSSLIRESIEWIAGESAVISVDKGKSIHGARQETISARVDNRKGAYESFLRLGEKTMAQLLDEDLSARIDEDKNFHIRLDISSLVSEKIKINNSDNMIAKGIFKIECYPGDKPEKIVSELIKKNIDD
jgi:RNA binding exosome subunit